MAVMAGIYGIYGIYGVDSHGNPMFFVGDGAPLEL